jgi:hypothetical protein
MLGRRRALPDFAGGSAMRNAMFLGLGFLAALGFTARGASAQQVGRAFGQRGQVAISAERLLGVYVLNAEVEQSGLADGPGPLDGTVNARTELDSTSFVLLGNDDSPGPAALPRLAVDVFVINGLSVGGSLLYWTDSAESDIAIDLTPSAGPFPIRQHVEVDRTTFGFSPRVGYAYMFSPTFGIWPRGGISYVSSKTETTTQDFNVDGTLDDQEESETTFSTLSLTLEGLLVITPFEHVAFGVGPFIEHAVTGDAETENNPGNPATRLEGDLSATSFGITSSLIAWF